MSRERATERRNLANGIHKHASAMWAMGRSDRVAGLPRALKYGNDFYYLAGYEGERRKETRGAEGNSSGNC